MELSDREIKLLLAAGSVMIDQVTAFPNEPKNWMYAVFAMADDRVTEEVIDIEEEKLGMIRSEVELYKAFVTKEEAKRNSKIVRLHD